jgi:predicted XRE-type DNA-binding protein
LVIDSAYQHADNEGMDWKQIISDLTSTGLTQTDIALRVNLTQGAVSDLSTGKTREPFHTTGELLRALHRKHMKPRKPAKVD